MSTFDLFPEGDLQDITLNSKGNSITKREDIALIDADTVIFSACLAMEERQELFSSDFYTEEEWELLMNDPTYDKYEHCVYYINLDAAYDYALEKLGTIMENTGCKDWELHFTAGRESFRYTDVSSTYKANRQVDNQQNRAPTGLMALKKLFVEKHPDKAFLWTEWEADDIVVAKKFYWPNKYLLCALDKDVLWSLEGTHFNYYSSTQYKIDMKFFDCDKDTAMKHHYRQVLTGDSSDGIIGLDRVGAKTADKILKHCSTEEECWDTVVEEYEKRGRTVIDAVTNMRLASMNQLVLKDDGETFEVVLWQPKHRR